jgi:hypothetical protein
MAVVLFLHLPGDERGPLDAQIDAALATSRVRRRGLLTGS